MWAFGSMPHEISIPFWTEERPVNARPMFCDWVIMANAIPECMPSRKTTQISTNLVLMDRMARRKERHNVSNLFGHVKPVLTCFDRVVATIPVGGDVLQFHRTYITYYKSDLHIYIYIYWLCKLYGFYAYIYIYMYTSYIYIYIHISETKCKSRVYSVCIYIYMYIYVYLYL